MKTIPLTHGKAAVVDDEDYERIARLSPWYYKPSNGYAVTFFKVQGRRMSVYLHKILMSALPGEEVDHVDRDKLNCRRSNLRRATHAQNNQNRTKLKNNSSGYKGVSFHKRFSKWTANIKVGGRLRHLGYFSTKEQAALAYNEAAIKHHGEFCALNAVPAIPLAKELKEAK